MGNSSKVTQTMAAEMVGISRVTISRHIKDGKLSKDSDGKIDVSELVRVYGDIQTPEELEEKKANKNDKGKKEDGSPTISEIEYLKKQLESNNLERTRERELLSGQIEDLKERLQKSEEREKNITLLLTNQNKDSQEEQTRKEREREAELKALKDAVARIEDNQGKGFFGLFSRKKKA